MQTGDPGAAVFMNNPTGNGTFATAAAASNTGTGVIDAGSVTARGLGARASTPSHSPMPALAPLTDGSGNPVTTGTYNGASGAEVAFNGIQAGITGTPAAGDKFTLSPSGTQERLDTLDNLVSAADNAGSGAAARAQLSTVLAARSSRSIRP